MEYTEESFIYKDLSSKVLKIPFSVGLISSSIKKKKWPKRFHFTFQASG